MDWRRDVIFGCWEKEEREGEGEERRRRRRYIYSSKMAMLEKGEEMERIDKKWTSG